MTLNFPLILHRLPAHNSREEAIYFEKKREILLQKKLFADDAVPYHWRGAGRLHQQRGYDRPVRQPGCFRFTHGDHAKPDGRPFTGYVGGA